MDVFNSILIKQRHPITIMMISLLSIGLTATPINKRWKLEQEVLHAYRELDSNMQQWAQQKYNQLDFQFHQLVTYRYVSLQFGIIPSQHQFYQLLEQDRFNWLQLREWIPRIQQDGLQQFHQWADQYRNTYIHKPVHIRSVITDPSLPCPPISSLP